MDRLALFWFCSFVSLWFPASEAPAKEVPRNGGFEQQTENGPLGWQLQGAWKPEDSSPHSGGSAIRLDAEDSSQWNKVLSAGCVARVYQGDELSLSCFYKSTTGNVDIGLEFCDVAGEHVKWCGVAPEGPAKGWTRLARRFTIDAELWRLGVRMVRVYGQVTQDGSGVSFDDLLLGVERKSPEAALRTKAIRIDPLDQKELLRDGFETFSAGVPVQWRAIAPEDETGEIEQDATIFQDGKGSLRISGVQTRLMLMKTPLGIDPNVSYVVSCWMKCQGTDSGRGIIKVDLLDEEGVPTGEPFSGQIGWHSDFIEKRIEIPWDRIPPEAAQMQVSLGVRGECPGSVWFDGLRIAPCELTMSASSSQAHNLFHTGDPAKITLKLYNCCLKEAKYDVTLTLADFWGRETTLTNRPVNLPPRTSTQETIDLEFPSLGYFKRTVRASRHGVSTSELVQDMALVTPFSEAIFAQDSPFGCHSIGPRPEFISLMREAYVKWVRVDADWRWIERERGKYDWSGLERQYGVYFDNGIGVLAIVGGCPEWNSSYQEGMPKTHWGESYGAYPPRDYEPWADFCAAFAAHFKGRINYWEVRNEPNIRVFWMGTPQEYANLLRAAYVGLHRGNPGCQVIFEVAGTDMSYYNAVYEAGGKGSCDILATHNYQLDHPGPPEKSTFLEEYHQMKEFLARQSEAEKPIWDTEFCWMSVSPRNRPGWKGVGGEKSQADYLVRSWTLALSAGVEKMFWFPFYSYDSAELNEPHPGGLVREDYSIKPVFVAHRVMAEHLVGAEYSRRIDVGPNARCYVFSKGDEELAVLWAVEDNQPISLTTKAQQVKVVDIMNNPSTISTRQGLLRFSATASPTYLTSSAPWGRQ
jgi:hypothetical protein